MDKTNPQRTQRSRWELTGQRALVTGGTKGIGAAIVDELLVLGASVVSVARGEGDVRAQAAEAGGKPLFGFVSDMATASGRQAALVPARGLDAAGLLRLVQGADREAA